MEADISPAFPNPVLDEKFTPGQYTPTSATAFLSPGIPSPTPAGSAMKLYDPSDPSTYPSSPVSSGYDNSSYVVQTSGPLGGAQMHQEVPADLRRAIAIGMTVFSLLQRYSSKSPITLMSSLTIPLNDGNRIPWLGFGTGTALYLKDAEQAVLTAINNGIIHLDGAQMYGNEESLGAAIAASGKTRSSLYVTTKLDKLREGQTVREAFLESLGKLKLDYVDLYLIHMPVAHEGRLKAVWKEFEALKKEGLAKSIGVSNFRVRDLEELLDGATVVPAVNQIEYHPYVVKAAQPVIEYMKKHGILPTSYGGLTPIVRFKGGPVDPVLSSIRERLQKTSGKPVTEGQVLGLWLRAKGIPEITTTSKVERIKEYIATETLPDLTVEEVHAIDEAGSQVHHRVFAQWLDAAKL
ncbi:NAD/NADP-dependent indole-3-acetaldehyde reductase [Grifola frondosa]|uniref:NAD/NADP-dependent indole-3-acetaldehyde reductase n=1 Tax=Grifola frondosa TaxID=5627 RepID=A0A1C7MFD0_GRIFR|nr:NAD/NADP-dependent indole-3-acetaldehyde reductase [Grifola frondosa]